MLAIFFYIFAAISVLSALSVVLFRNPVYSALGLVITFFAIAAQYILLNAQFVAAVQVMVYAGAIMVLFLFVIMLLNLNVNNEPLRPALLQGVSVATSGGMLFLVLLAATRSAGSLNPAHSADNTIGLIQTLGQTLFNQYLMPFEVSSLLFLSAMVGAVMLGKKEYK